MKKFVKLLIGLIVLVLIAAIAIGVWKVGKLFIRHFDAWIFYGYLSIAVLLYIWLAFCSYRNFLTMRSLTDADQINFGLALALQRSRPLGRFRLTLGVFLDCLHQALLFPWGITQQFKTFKSNVVEPGPGLLTRISARANLSGVQVSGTLVMTLILVFSLSIYYRDPANFYASFWAGILVVAILVRMLSLMLQGISFPHLLRSQLGNPYLRFVWMAFTSGILLLCGFSIIRSQVEGRLLDIQLIISTASLLFRLEQAWELFKNHEHIGTLGYIILGSAGIYYAAVLHSLKHWKEFSRSPEDYAKIARSLIILGRYNEALKWAGTPTQQDAVCYFAKGIALLCINRFEEALEALRRSDNLGETRWEGSLYFTVLSAAGTYLLPPRVIMRILDRWLNEDPKPGELLLSLQSLISTKLLPSDSCNALALDPRIIARPIHHAIILIQIEKQKEAQELLLKALPGSELEEIARIVLLLLVGLGEDASAEDSHKRIHAWLDTELRKIEGLCDNMKSSDLTVVYFLLASPLAVLRMIKVQREDELLYLRDRLKTKVLSDIKSPEMKKYFEEIEKQLGSHLQPA